ncbi:MAG: hypothetical protein IPP66_23435 [Anaerolineales bacterium]|nr:hypothetical protein [Anaerolineales bacterium]
MGTDAIKVALLYKPAVVTPVGQTAALNTEAFVNGGDSAPRSRPSLAQAFEQNSNGQRFIVNVNHPRAKAPLVPFLMLAMDRATVMKSV